MTKKDVKNAIDTAKAALSAKGIAFYLEIDKTSEVLREIEDVCWEMVEEGNLIAIDTREQKNGMLAFI